MNDSVPEISLWGLAWGFVPALIVVGIFYRWALTAGTPLYALGRMLVQLLLVGYVLTFIFTAEHAAIVVGVLAVMLVAASWIALRPLRPRQQGLYPRAFAAIFLSGVPILALVTQLILGVEPWFQPRYVIPLAGMIFASSMNAVSLAAERFQAERDQGREYAHARGAALAAALIPITNSLFAVGLVSLPGMMTGQILSGVSPLVAVRYQIVVMAMIFGANGLAAALYLRFARRSAAV